jgi:hypothetical protein
MGVKPTFCSICNRSVYVAHTDALSCPVCSSPLLEPAAPAAEVDAG